METQEKLTKAKRKFYPENLKVNRWRTVKKEFLNLLDLPIQSGKDLEYLIEKSGEGIKILFDYRNKMFIDMKAKTSFFKFFKFVFFQKRIISKGLHYNHLWESKIDQSPFKHQLDSKKYGHLLKIISHQKKMYVPSNDKLIAKEEQLGNRYNLITSRLGAKFDGKYCTIAELERKLLNPDREVRHSSYLAIAKIYQEKKSKFELLFDQLLTIRHSIALNAGYENYRDYVHEAKGRFSYTIQDVLSFHRVIEEEVVPVLKLMNDKTAESLGIKELKPWDVKIEGKNSHIPYRNEKDLLDKCYHTLNDIKPEYGLQFKKMAQSGLFDLFNRKKKSPGSYNIPMFELGSSFIFANFIEEKGAYQDVAILHHEFGHALHNFFTQNEPIMAYRNFPSEIAEFAAMAMEILATEHLKFYYQNPQHREEAKWQQFKRFLQIIVARTMGDLYQHWIYTHPGHSVKERDETYTKLMNRYNEGVSWKGVEQYQPLEYLKVLHFFQVPFYYIEYAFAALGALDLYRRYKENRSLTLKKYEQFLEAGYSKDVHLLYEDVGISFVFTPERVRELMKFVRHELQF